MSPPVSSARTIGPVELMQMNTSFTTSCILKAGVRLGVFSQLASGPRTAAEVARAIGASGRGMRMLLDGLTALQLLAKSEGSYSLTQPAALYLVRESSDYLGGIMEDDSLWQAWSGLTEAVRTGQPARNVNQREKAEHYFSILVRALDVSNREPARRAAQVLLSGTAKRGLRVLDIGCGSAVWSMALAEADPGAVLTLHDFPQVLELTRTYAERHGVAARCRFLAGDLKEVDFGESAFDVAFLGNIVHSEGEQSSRDLFRRMCRALAPAGQLAILEMVPDDDRAGPPYPVIFALNMLVNTQEGDTYTLAEYRQWLTEAGFARVDTADIGSHSPLIVARKT